MEAEQFKEVMKLNLKIPRDAKRFLKEMEQNQRFDDQQFEQLLGKLMTEV